MTASPWTAGDRALMLAYDAYTATLCPGCGHPIELAWHPDNDGFFDAESATCHACTAMDRAADPDSTKPVKPHDHMWATYTRPPDKPLPPLPPTDLT